MAESVVGYKRCPQQHILGQIRQTVSERSSLALFAQAVDYGQDMPEVVEVVAIIHSATAIRCSICGEVIEWRGEWTKK